VWEPVVLRRRAGEEDEADRIPGHEVHVLTSSVAGLDRDERRLLLRGRRVVLEHDDVPVTERDPVTFHLGEEQLLRDVPVPARAALDADQTRRLFRGVCAEIVLAETRPRLERRFDRLEDLQPVRAVLRE
jgi:hypothetical protein